MHDDETPRIRLSCCDHSFPLLPHADACELVRMLGFDAIDLALWSEHSHLKPEELRRDVAGWAARLGERIHGRGLALGDVFLISDGDYRAMAVNNPSRDERERGRELFEEMLQLVTLLGGDGITLIPGMEFDGVAHEQSLERAAEELAVRVELGRAAGVRVSVEPHFGAVVATPADVTRLLELTPGLELTLDTSHFVLQGIAPEQLDPVLPRVRHVHVRGSRRDRLQVPLAESEDDVGRLVRGLCAAGFAGSVATEYLWVHVGGLDELDTLSETILMRDALRALLDAPS